MKGKIMTYRLPLRSSSVVQRPFLRTSKRPWQSFAKYHSYDHPSAPPYSPTAHSILSASLSHVPVYGFTQESLRRGAKDAGYMAISTNLFPQGAFDLITFYLMTRRLALKDAVNGEEGYAKVWRENEVGIESRVRSLLLERLRMNDEFGVIEKWPEVRTARRSISTIRMLILG
jgi:ubiquinone biosynthesis protein COQ9